MAVAAGRVEYIPVQGNPVRVLVRVRLWAAADLDLGDKITRAGHNRDGVAEIAFQANGFPFRV